MKSFKSLMLLTAVTLTSAAPSFAADMNIAKVKQLVANYVNGSAISVEVAKVNEGICGSEGSAYVAVVSMNKFEKVLNESGMLDVREVPVEIATYGITTKELKKGTTDLMQPEQCLE